MDPSVARDLGTIIGTFLEERRAERSSNLSITPQIQKAVIRGVGVYNCRCSVKHRWTRLRAQETEKMINTMALWSNANATDEHTVTECIRQIVKNFQSLTKTLEPELEKHVRIACHNLYLEAKEAGLLNIANHSESLYISSLHPWMQKYNSGAQAGEDLTLDDLLDSVQGPDSYQSYRVIAFALSMLIETCLEDTFERFDSVINRDSELAQKRHNLGFLSVLAQMHPDWSVRCAENRFEKLLDETEGRSCGVSIKAFECARKNPNMTQVGDLQRIIHWIDDDEDKKDLTEFNNDVQAQDVRESLLQQCDTEVNGIELKRMFANKLDVRRRMMGVFLQATRDENISKKASMNNVKKTIRNFLKGEMGTTMTKQAKRELSDNYKKYSEKSAEHVPQSLLMMDTQSGKSKLSVLVAILECMIIKANAVIDIQTNNGGEVNADRKKENTMPEVKSLCDRVFERILGASDGMKSYVRWYWGKDMNFILPETCFVDACGWNLEAKGSDTDLTEAFNNGDRGKWHTVRLWISYNYKNLPTLERELSKFEDDDLLRVYMIYDEAHNKRSSMESSVEEAKKNVKRQCRDAAGMPQQQILDAEMIKSIHDSGKLLRVLDVSATTQRLTVSLQHYNSVIMVRKQEYCGLADFRFVLYNTDAKTKEQMFQPKIWAERMRQLYTNEARIQDIYGNKKTAVSSVLDHSLLVHHHYAWVDVVKYFRVIESGQMCYNLLSMDDSRETLFVVFSEDCYVMGTVAAEFVQLFSLQSEANSLKDFVDNWSKHLPRTSPKSSPPKEAFMGFNQLTKSRSWARKINLWNALQKLMKTVCIQSDEARLKITTLTCECEEASRHIRDANPSIMYERLLEIVTERASAAMGYVEEKALVVQAVLFMVFPQKLVQSYSDSILSCPEGGGYLDFLKERDNGPDSALMRNGGKDFVEDNRLKPEQVMNDLASLEKNEVYLNLLCDGRQESVLTLEGAKKNFAKCPIIDGFKKACDSKYWVKLHKLRAHRLINKGKYAKSFTVPHVMTMAEIFGRTITQRKLRMIYVVDKTMIESKSFRPQIDPTDTLGQDLLKMIDANDSLNREDLDHCSRLHTGTIMGNCSDDDTISRALEHTMIQNAGRCSGIYISQEEIDVHGKMTHPPVLILPKNMMTRLQSAYSHEKRCRTQLSEYGSINDTLPEYEEGVATNWGNHRCNTATNKASYRKRGSVHDDIRVAHGQEPRRLEEPFPKRVKLQEATSVTQTSGAESLEDLYEECYTLCKQSVQSVPDKRSTSTAKFCYLVVTAMAIRKHGGEVSYKTIREDDKTYYGGEIQKFQEKNSLFFDEKFTKFCNNWKMAESKNDMGRKTRWEGDNGALRDCRGWAADGILQFNTDTKTVSWKRRQ